MNRVLGIDQSFTSTGWCILNDGVVEGFGIFTSDKNKTRYERARDVADEIEQFIITRSGKGLEVAIEGIPFMSRSNVTRDLAGLQFLIMDRLIDMYDTEEVTIVPPTVLKKFATGSGKADKNAMFEALPTEVRGKFKTTLKTKGRSDITDAYWLAKYKESLQ